MKIQTSQIPSANLSSDLVLYVIDADSSNKNPHTPDTNLPLNLKNQISDSFVLNDFNNDKPKLILYHFPDSEIKRLLFCRIDKTKEISEELRKSAGKIYSSLQGLKIRNSHAVINMTDHEETKSIAAFIEGLLLKAYHYSDLKSKKDDSHIVEIDKLTFLLSGDSDHNSVKKAIKKAEILIEGVNFARRLGDTPGNLLTPSQLARQIQKRFKDDNHITLKVLNESEIKNLKMNAFLSIANGSKEAPRLVTMQYRSKNKKSGHLLLVGKGVTFDSGGISIKPSASMEEMKFDMCGAAAVAGVMDVVAKIKPDLNVTGIIPAAENLPDAAAVKPGDVVRAYNGKTIEVINTDAEGRMLLADALAYGIKKYHPDWVIDLATLTGSVVVALGSHASGLFSNDKQLTEQINTAASASGEKVWEMPIWDEYKSDLDSDVADLKNVGGREAGSISAAKFLQEFVGEVPWAHLDIAGTAYDQKHLPYLDKGASGVGVRLLIELLSILK